MPPPSDHNSAAAAPIRPAAPPDIPPYSAAVAARFPAPSVVYNTPGLQRGGYSFTSQPEVRRWLREQASAAVKTAGIKAVVVAIGRSQAGEELEALILTRAPGTDAASLQATGRPTLLLTGQQTGNEAAAGEALLVIARELAQGLLQPLLQSINVVIVPRANPDGLSANGRAGLDIQRDHLLLSTPEAQALARLARDYRPAVMIDSREYSVTGTYLENFGAVQKFDALLQYATAPNLPEFLTKAAEEWFRRPLLAAFKAQGLSAEWYYSASKDPADKKISMGAAQADDARNVYGLKNQVSLQIASRGSDLGRLNLQRRVHTHVIALSSVLASTSQRASQLTQLRPYIDKEVSAMACTAEAIVEAAPTPAQYELTMLDPVSGADKTVTVDWDSALVLRKVNTRTRPCGYLLDEASGTAVERLRMHGVQVQRVAEAGAVLGDRYTVAMLQDGPAGSPPARVKVGLSRGLVEVPRGGFYVPMNQAMGNIAVAALEPDAPGSFFAGGLLPATSSTVRVMAPPSMKLEELP